MSYGLRERKKKIKYDYDLEGEKDEDLTDDYHLEEDEDESSQKKISSTKRKTRKRKITPKKTSNTPSKSIEVEETEPSESLTQEEHLKLIKAYNLFHGDIQKISQAISHPPGEVQYFINHYETLKTVEFQSITTEYNRKELEYYHGSTCYLDFGQHETFQEWFNTQNFPSTLKRSEAILKNHLLNFNCSFEKNQIKSTNSPNYHLITQFISNLFQNPNFNVNEFTSLTLLDREVIHYLILNLINSEEKYEHLITDYSFLFEK